MSDLISIVTTLYNYKKYVGDLAESVKRQTYKNWEWIIVDDCSTDEPTSILEKYLSNQVTYIRLDNNMGYSFAKNVGIRKSRGKYVVMIDADDMLTNNSLEIRYDLMQRNPNKLWCHGEVLVKDEGVKTLSHRSLNWKKSFRKQLKRKGLNFTNNYHHRLIHAQSVMVTRALHKKYGLYDESLRFSSDNEMWRRLIRFGEIPAHTEKFVAIYRVHKNRMCQSEYKKKRLKWTKQKIKVDVEVRFNEGININNTPLL